MLTRAWPCDSPAVVKRRACGKTIDRRKRGSAVEQQFNGADSKIEGPRAAVTERLEGLRVVRRCDRSAMRNAASYARVTATAGCRVPVRSMTTRPVRRDAEELQDDVWRDRPASGSAARSGP